MRGSLKPWPQFDSHGWGGWTTFVCTVAWADFWQLHSLQGNSARNRATQHAHLQRSLSMHAPWTHTNHVSHSLPLLTVEAKAFREGHRYKQLQPSFDKLPNAPHISLQVTRGKTLIRTVKKWEQSTFLQGEIAIGMKLQACKQQDSCYLHYSKDALPFLLGGINSCWVMSTGMQNHNGAFWGSLKDRRTITHAAASGQQAFQ